MVDFVWVFEREHEMGFISVRSVDAESDTGLANASHQTAAASPNWLLALQHHRQPGACCIEEQNLHLLQVRLTALVFQLRPLASAAQTVFCSH